jgi:hypothetical protein
VISNNGVAFYATPKMVERRRKHRDGTSLVREPQLDRDECEQGPDAKCDLQEREDSYRPGAAPQMSGL